MNAPAVRVEQTGEQIDVFLHGELTLDTTPTARDALFQAIAQRAPSAKLMRVNLAALERIDTSGLAILIETLLQARDAQLQLRLQQVGANTMQWLQLAKLDQVFEIDP